MNKGPFRVPKRTQKDYSLAFKLQVVDEVEKGELSEDAFNNFCFHWVGTVNCSNQKTIMDRDTVICFIYNKLVNNGKQ